MNVLIVGVGSIGERHLRCFGATGRATLSLCELNPALREQVAARYGVAALLCDAHGAERRGYSIAAFADYEQALAAKPQVVVICTPANLHIAMAARAVEAGAHVFIEKPLSTKPDGIAELDAAVKQRGLIAGVAYVYRAHPALAAMRAALRSGRFGAPVQFVATCGQHFPLYRPAYRDIYYKDRATGGGAVQDALTHVMNAAEWLVGPVTALAADFDHKVLEGVTVEDTVHVITRHGAVMGNFSLNQHQAPNETSLTVICERGTARFEVHQNRWRWQTQPGGDWTDEPGAPMERDTWFTCQAHAFLDAVEGKAPVLCTIDEAAATLRVNLAILAAAEQRRWITP